MARKIQRSGYIDKNGRKVPPHEVTVPDAPSAATEPNVTGNASAADPFGEADLDEGQRWEGLVSVYRSKYGDDWPITITGQMAGPYDESNHEGQDRLQRYMEQRHPDVEVQYDSEYSQFFAYAKNERDGQIVAEACADVAEWHDAERNREIRNTTKKVAEKLPDVADIEAALPKNLRWAAKGIVANLHEGVRREIERYL